MRIGKFYIAPHFVHAEPDQVRRLMDGMTVVYRKHLWLRGAIEYVAIGDMFDETPAGSEPPVYDCIVECSDGNGLAPVITWRRS